MWKRNLILVIALHIGLCLFPLLTVPQEKLTAIRVATAMGVVVFIYLIEVLLIYSTIRKHGLKPKEGLIRILELKEEEYTELKEEERRLVEKIGFLIIGFPLLALILSGGILTWGDIGLAIKFLLVFFAFIIPLLQLCILPLVIFLHTYNKFIRKDVKACVNTSEYWIQLAVTGLILVELSLVFAGEHEKEVLPFLITIADHHTVFVLAALLNVFVGVLQYVIAVAKSRSVLASASLLLFSSPVFSITILLELFGVYLIQESLKVAVIGALAIFTAMFTATWLTLKIFGYSLDSFEKAVENTKIKSRKPLKNILFWIFWVNAAIVGFGIFFVTRILQSFL